LVQLRKAKLTDAQELFNITQDKEVMKYYGMGAYDTLSEAEDEIKWFLSLLDEEQGVRWIIADSTNDKYIGDVGIFNYNPDQNRIEIGFKLKRDYWNKGIMSSCIKQVLDFGFNDMKVNRIEALIDKRNPACKNTLKKCGFSYEGLLREYELENEEYVDLEMHSILFREYKR
jgi:ribosomal-protein-alanine N-acetyltransferase